MNRAACRNRIVTEYALGQAWRRKQVCQCGKTSAGKGAASSKVGAEFEEKK